jgi:hypothetical protein
MTNQKVLDKELYAKAKRMADKVYDRPSAYKSGYIVKTYKRLGGRYSGKKGSQKKGKLSRWFQEEWKDVNPFKTDSSYPVYRPTIRVSQDTPLTINEINLKDLEKKAKIKQRYKNKIILAPFKKKKKNSMDDAYKILIYQ